MKNNSCSDSSLDSSSETNSKDSISFGEKTEKTEEINPVKFFSIKELCYYKMIDKYFKNCNIEHINKMMNIINGESDISLRVLDWFVTKYSKKKYDNKQQKDIEIFDVRISYKSQLKSYKKRYFDPFRRRKKFIYHFNDDKCISTTLGQLNFFKWAFAYNIVQHVEKNLSLISKEMNLSNKEDKKKKNKQKEDEKTKAHSQTNKQIKNDENKKINTSNVSNNGEVRITLKFD